MIHTKELPSIPPTAPGEGEVWQHAGGDIYIVVGLGYIEATLDVIVVYRQQMAWTMWVRPLANFLERFKRI